MKRWVMVIALVASFGVPAMAAGSNSWEVDSVHSGIYFVVRHLGIMNVHGSFNLSAGTVEFDEQDISKSSVNAAVTVSSVSTGVEARDKHLQTADFFDAAKYPTITFQSTKIWKTSDGGSVNSVKMTGNLTIHGIAKEVTFDVTGPTPPIVAMGATRRGISATTKVNRKDFGITFDPTVGDDVTIILEIDMIKK